LGSGRQTGSMGTVKGSKRLVPEWFCEWLNQNSQQWSKLIMWAGAPMKTVLDFQPTLGPPLAKIRLSAVGNAWGIGFSVCPDAEQRTYAGGFVTLLASVSVVRSGVSESRKRKRSGRANRKVWSNCWKPPPAKNSIGNESVNQVASFIASSSKMWCGFGLGHSRTNFPSS